MTLKSFANHFRGGLAKVANKVVGMHGRNRVRIQNAGREVLKVERHDGVCVARNRRSQDMAIRDRVAAALE